jgi:hypothetical protein
MNESSIVKGNITQICKRNDEERRECQIVSKAKSYLVDLDSFNYNYWHFGSSINYICLSVCLSVSVGGPLYTDNADALLQN